MGLKQGSTDSHAPYRSAAFGQQAYSHRKNEPLYSFGTGSVEARASLYLGKEFCPHQVHLAVSPGPAAYNTAPPIPPVSGRAHTAPGGRSRLSSSTPINLKWSASNLDRYGSGSVGGSVGTPGIGAYKTVDSTVGQRFASASLTNSPRFSWTNVATREKQQNVYVSPAHERELLGKFSPGPHVVGRDAFDSMGKQASSLRRTMPRFAPSKAPRTLALSGSDKSSWPGPAHYDY